MEEAKTIVDECRDEEQDGFDNLSEGLQCSERGVAMEEAASNLDSASDSIQDAIDNIEEAMQ